MSNTRQVCTMNCGPAKDDPMPWEDRIRGCPDCEYVPIAPAPTMPDKLRALSAHMETVAVEMDYFGGFAPWVRHGGELMGAARLVAAWAEECSAGKDRQ